MKQSSRREFLGKASFLGVGSLTMPLTKHMEIQNKLLVHHVFFWLKQSGSSSDRAKLVEGLQTLKAIPTILQFHIGYPASTEKRAVVDNSWDVSALMFFTDLAAQQTYQDHPIHQAFIKNYSHLWSKVVVYDAMDVVG